MARIFYLSSATIPGKPAHTVQVMNMCSALAEIGNEVTLFCKRPHQSGQTPFEYYGIDETFSIISLPARRLRYLGGFIYYRDMARAAARLQSPDILYGRNPNAFILMEKIRSLRIIEAHNMPPNRIARITASRLYRHPQFRTQVAVNNALRKDLLKMFPELPPDKCIVAPNGCTIPSNNMEPVDLPGRAAAPKIGYIGHLYPGKGMEIIAELPALVPEADFHIVGGMEDDIRHWRRELDSPNIFFHGHVPAGQVARYIKGMDIALAPLQHQIFHFKPGQEFGRYTSPLKLLEYMVIGVPVIASDIEPVRELITEDESVLLVDPENPEKWRAAIVRLLANKEFSKRMANNARVEVLKNQTWPQRAARILKHATEGE